MLDIIKDSFFEGRKTKVEWKESESYKIEKQISEIDFNNRKIAQVTTSGKTLNVFKNIKDACNYVRVILKKEPSNIRYAVLANCKSLGYFWTLLASENKSKITYVNQTAKPIVVIDAIGNINEYKSSREACI
jgi:hypothetical protein